MLSGLYFLYYLPARPTRTSTCDLSPSASIIGDYEQTALLRRQPDRPDDPASTLESFSTTVSYTTTYSRTFVFIDAFDHEAYGTELPIPLPHAAEPSLSATDPADASNDDDDDDDNCNDN